MAATAACVVFCLAGCSGSNRPVNPYGAQGARLGEALALLGWNMSVSNLRWDSDYVLVDVSASLASAKDPHAPHAKPEDIRFGLYGALAHPMEASGLGSCDNAMASAHDIGSPLSAPPDRLTGTVFVGPLPTNANDTGLVVKTANISAWRADGTPVTKAQLGDAGAFNGNGYMLLGLEADSVAARYRDDSAKRGGPMMLLASPTLPGPGLNPACAAYGSSVLILPEASLDAVHVNASLCTQGEINEALLYATVAIDGTHAGVWTQR